MEDYVRLVGDDAVHVSAKSPSGEAVIRMLGGDRAPGDDVWRLPYSTEDDLVRLLQTLRDAGIAFAGGSSGWPPAAIAETLREKGKLHGTIREVTWRAPGDLVICER